MNYELRITNYSFQGSALERNADEALPRVTGLDNNLAAALASL
jgi:hypothetical protein